MGVPLERDFERSLPGHFRGRDVRDVVEIGGNLDGQLPHGDERVCQSCDQLTVLWHPVQRGIREDKIEVPAPTLHEGPNVLVQKPKTLGSRALCVTEHGVRAIDTDRLPGFQATMELRGELARATAQIHDPHSRARTNQIQQIEKRLLALLSVAQVLLRPPRVLSHYFFIQPSGCDKEGPCR